MKQKQENTGRAVRDIEDGQSAIKKELGEQAESSLDLGELKAAVASVRKAGDLEQRSDEAQKRASEDNEACQVEEFH